MTRVRLFKFSQQACERKFTVVSSTRQTDL